MGRGNSIWGGVVVGGAILWGTHWIWGTHFGDAPIGIQWGGTMGRGNSIWGVWWWGGDPFWGCTHLDSIEEGEPWGRGTLNGGDVLAGGGEGGAVLA